MAKNPVEIKYEEIISGYIIGNSYNWYTNKATNLVRYYKIFLTSILSEQTSTIDHASSPLPFTLSKWPNTSGYDRSNWVEYVDHIIKKQFYILAQGVVIPAYSIIQMKGQTHGGMVWPKGHDLDANATCPPYFMATIVLLH